MTRKILSGAEQVQRKDCHSLPSKRYSYRQYQTFTGGNSRCGKTSSILNKRAHPLQVKPFSDLFCPLQTKRGNRQMVSSLSI
jgi:hypothetical protein